MKKGILGKIILMLALCFIVVTPAKAEEVNVVEYKKGEGFSYELKCGSIWKVKYKYDETEEEYLEEWCLYDKNGQLLSEYVFDEVDPVEMYKNKAWVSLNGKKGIIDVSNGSFLVVPQYVFLSHFLDDNNNLIYRANNLLYGLMNFQGKKLTEPIYTGITEFTKDRYLAKKENGQYVLLDTNGKEKKELKYYSVSLIYNNRAVVEKQERNNGLLDIRCGVIDEKGNVIIKPSYDYIGHFSNNRAVMRKNGKYGVIDTKGKVIVKPQYDYIDSYSNNRAVMRKNKKYGVIDTKGKVIVKPQYDYIDSYSNNRAVVEKNGKYEVIDTKGKVIVKPQYDYIEKFFNNEKMMMVEKNEKYGIIDMKGKVIAKPNYDWVDRYTSNNRIIIIKNKKYGVIDTKGKVIVKPQYNHIEQFYEKYAVVEKNGKRGLIDTKGNIVVKIAYDEVGNGEIFEGKKVCLTLNHEDILN